LVYIARLGSEGGDTRERILRAAYALFYRKGFSRISMDAVAERAGVTKRTIYYHFQSKDEVVAEVLEVQHLHLMREFVSWSGVPGGSPETVIDGLFSKLLDWAGAPGWLGSGFTRLTTELADLPGHPARRAAGLHKEAIEDWLSARLADCGANQPEELARQVTLLIEGGMSLAFIHGDTDYIRSAAKTASTLAAKTKTAPGGAASNST